MLSSSLGLLGSFRLSRSLAPEVFPLSSDKLNRQRNIGYIFSRYSSWAHLAPALQDSENLIQGT